MISKLIAICEPGAYLPDVAALSLRIEDNAGRRVQIIHNDCLYEAFPTEDAPGYRFEIIAEDYPAQGAVEFLKQRAQQVADAEDGYRRVAATCRELEATLKEKEARFLELIATGNDVERLLLRRTEELETARQTGQQWKELAESWERRVRELENRR